MFIRVSLGLAIALLFALAGFVPRAQAAGFDTPILYSARQMGMGGTAIASVADPSAAFHNPAGFGNIRGLSLLGNVSLLTGKITSSPGGGLGDLPDKSNNYPSRTSEQIVGPGFLVAAGYRLSEYLSLGVAVFPVASASAEYRGTSLTGNASIDKTKLVFLEATPVLALSLPHDIRLGVGYRVTFAELERVQGDRDNPRNFDFKASGLNLKGVRVGAQWRLDPHWSFGAVYRHKIEPKLTADSGVAYADVEDLKTSFILPSKLGAGVRSDWDPWGFALDVEYGFYSQNERTRLEGCNINQPAQAEKPSCRVAGVTHKTEYADNVFDWQNAVTVRAGLEYRVREAWPLRVGYIFDGQATNVHYPSAFGTPPAPSHSGTVGAGYRAEKWELNVAAALRTASSKVKPSDTEGYDCATCGKAGKDYSLWLAGGYVDFSYNFDLKPLF